MDWNMIEYVILSVFWGAIGSLIAWGIINVIVAPKFNVSKVLYSNGSRPYIKIWNESWHGQTACNVVCYLYYYEKSDKKVFFREDNKAIILKKGNADKEAHIIKLDGDERINNFFCVGNKIKVIIIGHNKYGAKQILTKWLNIEDEITNHNIITINYNDSNH